MIHKEDLVNSLVDEKGYTKKAANQVIDDLVETITGFLAQGESVMLRGFGTFEVRKQSARESVMPNTLERYTIEPKKRCHFVVGKALRSAVRGE